MVRDFQGWMTPENTEHNVKKRDLKHVTGGPFTTRLSYPFLMEGRFAAWPENPTQQTSILKLPFSFNSEDNIYYQSSTNEVKLNQQRY